MEDINKLYDIYAKDIYKFIMSIALNHEVAEDIMQSTFLSAIKSIHTFKGHSSVKTWLFGIAKNEYYTYLRKNPRNLKLEDINEIHYIQENNELYMSIMKKIQELKEPQKQIVILRIINDMSFAEIGEVVGKSENYCRVNFFREKQKLWEAIKNE